MHTISRSLKIAFLITFLIGCTGLIALSERSTHSGGGAPMRLRLKVENNTLRSGAATRISAEFLNRDYQQVPNDGTRVVEFEIGGPQGAGTISPQRVTVRPGEWSANATFASRQPGKVLISARTEGLDADQTVLLVTRQAASFLSHLFETVAYAQDSEGFEVLPRSVKTSAGARGKFQLVFSEKLTADTTIRISTDPLATINYDGQDFDGVKEITLAEGEGVSKNIYVTSQDVGNVQVLAAVRPNGPQASAISNFTAPCPSRIVFDDDLRDIPSNQTAIPISIQLADDRGNPLESDERRSITFKRANEEDPVEFEPPSVVFLPNQRSAQAMLRLKGLPWGNELTLLAVSQEDNRVKTGRKTIIIRSPIEKVLVTGPSEVTRGNYQAEFTVHLADKEGKPRTADWDRKVNLSVTSGQLSPTQVPIPKGQDSAKVKYVSSNSTGRVVLKAESGGLTDGSLEFTLVTALYWLVLAALAGGMVGGVVRHVLRDHRLGRVFPKRIGNHWELGLVGRIASSIVCGLFLYLAMMFGLSRVLGSPMLPAGLNLGTRLVAFFFGGVGGFAGTVVFARLVRSILPASQKERVTTPPVASGVNQPARP